MLTLYPLDETLFYRVEDDTPALTTSLAVAKDLSLQLFEKNVGDEPLFYALRKAYNLSLSKNVTVADLEKAMWEALDVGLDQFTGKGKESLMIVIDGLNELKTNDSVTYVMEKLGVFTSKHGRLQAITLSRSSPHKPSKGSLQPLEIKPDYTHDDFQHVAEHAFHGYVHYRDQAEHDQEAIIERLVTAARGDFLWLLLTIYILRKESSHEAFVKAVKSAKDAPQSLHQTIGRITEMFDLSHPDAYLILSWMLVAERPLTVSEVKCLLQVDLQKKHIVERRTDIKADIQAALGPLVVFHNDFVRFRHPAIRGYLVGLRLQGTTKLLKPQAAQTDFTMRLLAYCKFNVTQRQEPSLEVIGMTHVKELFTQYALLEYAVRHWTSHFCASSMLSGEAFQLSADFKDLFPGSTMIAMLEWAIWSPQVFSHESHELALRVRETVFTEKHECVLQSLIVCGTSFRTLSRTTEAGNCFYRASRIGQAVLPKNNNLTLSCATTFLSVVETITMTTRNEIAMRKEETLRYVIGVCKHQHGQSHDSVIRYYKMLAQLYVEIHQEHKAEVVWRELREIIIMRFGKGSEEETSVSEQLTIVLRKGDRKTDIVEYEKGIFDITTELEVWDIRHIQLTLELAKSYEARKEYFLAEELYITLWRRLTERCHHPHHDHGVEIHIYMIEVALEYVRFLQRCHRHEEASNVLICIWTEYEEHEFESETLFLRLKIVGELMRAVSLLSVAVSVFKKCWAWFKSRGKTEHTASCEVLISETVEEIITTTITSATTSTTSTTSTTTETVVKEIFESTLTRKEVTTETISICKSLISYYMKLEQWSEAIEITKRSLSVIWKFIVSGAGTIALPHHHGAGAVDIAISLARCHHRSHHFHEAGEIYVRIYRACRNSCHIEDGRFVKSYEVLIKFYEDHKHWDKMFEIYQELLVQYRKTLGASHKLTIRTLYLLGSFCAEHGHGPALEYYEDIIRLLNHGSAICNVDALDAMFVVCRIHYEAGHWHKLKTVCKVLWDTWKDQHRGHDKFTADFIEILYLRYRYVLEHHESCEYSVLRQLTLEYRNTCIKVFGAAVAISIKAYIKLAEICMRSETYIHEAISTYEEILTKTKTTTTSSVISTTTITKIKESLIKAYVSVCSHGSVSTTTIERAIVMVRERFESLKITFGWAHTETLSCLRELVLLQLKIKRQESHTIVVHMLLETCIEIIKREKHSKQLHESAELLGGVYITCGLAEQGRSMIEDLRLQIITGTSKDKASLKLDNAVGKVSYVFLVTFEQVIRGRIFTYSEIMADLLAETILYESYHRCIKSEKEVTVILIQAAKLRAFLSSHHRAVQKDVLQKEAFEIFIRKYQTTIKRHDDIAFTFYCGLLKELGKEIRDVHIGSAACASSTATVKHLLNEGRIQEAYHVATCALEFINYQRAFHMLQNVPYGFKLSALMAGRGLDSPLKVDINLKLKESMLELSRKIIREVLRACKDSNINFTRLNLRELNDLAGLLGEQQNFADLEWLLELLWSSREVQKKWQTPTIIAIGRRFVQARYLNQAHRSRAIRLCEDICYNLRRVWGTLDPKSLEMSNLLSELYTSMGHYREAQGVHESILRLVVEGDDGEDRTRDTMDPKVTRKHLDLLKQSYLRLKGWDKSAASYKELVSAVLTMYKGSTAFKDAQGTDSWNFNKEAPSDTLGKFVAPREWEFAKPEYLDDRGDSKEMKGLRRPGMGVKRATSNWGIGTIQRMLHGFSDEDESEKFAEKEVLKKQEIVKTKQLPLDPALDEDGYESAAEEPAVNGNGLRV